MKERNIVVLSQTPPPTHGSSIITALLVQILVNEGFAVSLINRNFSKKVEEIGKYNLSKIIRSLSLLKEVWQKIRGVENPIMVLFLTTSRPALVVDLLAVFLCKISKIRICVYLHTYGFLEKKSSTFLDIAIYKFIFREAASCVVLSNKAKAEAARIMPANKVFVIPNTIQIPAKHRNGSVTSRDELTIDAIFLSNLLPEKGALDFLKIVNRLSQSIESPNFVIAGATSDVAYFEILKTYISANGLENCVSFVGHIAGEFKYELLRTSRCLIFTSVLEEAQPLVIIEANSQSTPVIAYDVGAISDLIEEGANGYLASKGDVDEVVLKYLKLIEDEALFSRIRSKSLATFLEVYSERRYTRDWTSHLLESMNDNYS